jgi:glucose/arabinose dehydrogenase
MAAILGGVVFALASSSNAGTPKEANFAESVHASGLTQITSIAWAPDGSNTLFVAQKGGALRVVRDGVVQATAVTTVTVTTASECGLIGLCVDPQYATNKYVYVFASVNASTQQILRITIGTDGSGNLVQTARQQIGPNLPCLNVNHDGGGMVIGEDGYLYFGVGNLGNANNVGGNGRADEWTSLGSKIGRMDRFTGAAVSSNPWYQSSNPASAQSYMFAKGLRNPYGLAIQPTRNRLWLFAVGDSWEQIFLVPPGGNVGWPTENNQSTTNGLLIPKLAYATNGSPFGGCITRGTFYRGSLFPSAYGGNLFFCDYNSGKVMRSVISFDGLSITSTAEFVTGNVNLVDIAVGPDGALYYASINGTIYRLRYVSQTPQNIVVSTTNLTVNETSTATFTVKLATAPAANVVVGVSRTIGTADATHTPASLTFTPSNWNVAQTVTVSGANDTDTIDEGATFACSASGLTTQNVVVTVRDNDLPAGSPRATITQPRNGDTVSGTTAEFYGDGPGCVRAEFYVDGVLKYTDVNSNGHYHINGDHNRWDTTSLSPGQHKLAMKVYTSGGLSGTHEITVVKAGSLLVNGTVYRATPKFAPAFALEVAGFGTADRSNVVIWTYVGGANQKWKAIDVGNGLWEFEPVHAPGKRLDVDGGQDINGRNVWIWASNSGLAQRWKLKDNGDGSISLTPQCSPLGRVLDVSYNRAVNGQNVWIFDPHGADNQRWIFSSGANVNMALNRTVTASSSVESGVWSRALAVDGLASTGWSSNNSLTVNHTEWVQVDLGATYRVARVNLLPRGGGTYFPIDFTIQRSEDGVNWVTVVTRTAFPQPSSSVQSFNFPVSPARYIRITGTNLRRNSAEFNYYRMQFMEIDVY